MAIGLRVPLLPLALSAPGITTASALILMELEALSAPDMLEGRMTQADMTDQELRASTMELEELEQ